MRLYANLHNHSTHSDGVYSPAELVRVAKKEGLGAIAVTDHDTATGYPELAEECKKQGMESIFGVEFTAPSDFNRHGFHIVGFDFDPEYPAMAEYLHGMSFRETDQTRQLFERGLASGYLHDITWQEVLDYNGSITWLCNEQVFRAMKAKGIFKDTDYYDFFHTVYGPHRGKIPPAYPFLPASKMVELINKAGGFAVLAHPHNQLEDVPKLMELGLRGLEVWHHDLPDEAERRAALTIAMENNLFVSGGEDHSGLCGGQYARYENPRESHHYAEPLTLGTTKFFFDEIKTRTLSKDRDAVLREILAGEV